uniref:Gypsy retrotransposon integrase-like protein 1 n=1 Tax=Astyanax mexicanus TaxID=7994 RepID=A0A3B1JJM2_ASTMX
MEAREASTGDAPSPPLDFTAGPFVTRRGSVNEIIDTLSRLYIDSEEEEVEQTCLEEQEELPEWPLPPPTLDAPIDDSLHARVAELEKCYTSLETKVQEMVEQQRTEMVEEMERWKEEVRKTWTGLEQNDKRIEQRLSYNQERQGEKLAKLIDMEIRELGKSVVDCLKRRDKQLEKRLQSVPPTASTPITPAKTVRHTLGLGRSSLVPESWSSAQVKPPIKLEFPKYGGPGEETDPITFIEKCEEFLAVRPLTNQETLAALTSVLSGTAKDWWKAERKSVKTWGAFKTIFLRSFLSEDYEAEAERCLRDRHQGINESIRDFAFQYRALCLRWKENMPEKELLQAILRNCNPRLASLLRGAVSSVDELVRVGTLVERDLLEAKSYWNRAHQDTSLERTPAGKGAKRGHPQSLGHTNMVQHASPQIKTLTLPLSVRGQQVTAMIDTGSTFSLIQEGTWDRMKRTQEVWRSGRGQKFILANGQTQTAKGVVELDCELGKCQAKRPFYVMENKDHVFSLVLGLDFLHDTGLILDFQKDVYILPGGDTVPFGGEGESPPFSYADMRLCIAQEDYVPLDYEEEQEINKLVEGADITSQAKQDLHKLLSQWPSVCTNQLGRTMIVLHHITTNDNLPIRQKPYKVSIEKQQLIKEAIEDMQRRGIVRPSTSPWASPVVLVPKKEGGVRFCVDYRRMNSKTHLDAYPMPQVQEILESLHGAAIFSTLDLKSGYWQVGLEPDSIPKTAFITCQGLYEFTVLPFGIKNAAATFQRLMDSVLVNLKGKSCFVYINDIVVYSSTIEQHLGHLEEVFRCLHQAGLTLNLRKCNLLQRSLIFLGHVISGEGICTEPGKVEAIQAFPEPRSIKELQRFLGMAGWYHRFITHFSERAAILNALKKKNAPWIWTQECQKAFEDIKQALITAPVLTPPNFSEPFQIQTDASDQGLGAVLSQGTDGLEHVVAYASRLLQGAERNYSTAEKECLAVVWAVEKWRVYLEGRHFTVITDHSALSWVFNHPKPTSRLTRWAIRLQTFDFSVQYRKGKCNIVPDTLSRIPDRMTEGVMAPCQVTGSSDGLPVDWAEIARAQEVDGTLQPQRDETGNQETRKDRIHFVTKNDILFRAVPNQQLGHTLQVVVPVQHREAFLQYAHDNPLSGHLGQMKTLLRLLNIAYWPSIRRDVWTYCKSCEICQKYKPRISKLSGRLQSTPVVEPGYMLGVDLMGPLPKSPRQNEHLLVIVDYCSKWVEMFPLREAKTSQIVQILIKDIFTRWGTPAYLVSDRGAQFTSRLLHATCRQWGVVQKLTTAYHPQTNLTERVNRTLKTMIASYVKDKHRLWDQWIPEFRFAINSAWQESTGFTPAEVALGRKLKGPLERLLSQPPNPDHDAYKVVQRQQDLFCQIRDNVDKAQAKQAKFYNRRRKQVNFVGGDLVWVETHPLSRADKGFAAKLAEKWKGPAKIIRKISPVNYEIEYLDDSSRVDTIHVENLKYYYGRVGSTLKGVGV